MTTIQREHKDRLFQKLFGDETNRKNLLSLFNALNNTNYTDENAIEINTIDDVIYMGMKNDVSCILDNYMSLSEHQSKFNPNMPIRGLMYFGRLYDKYIKQYGLNLYSTKLLKLPTSKYFVLYNGNIDKPDIINLKLSDSFIHKDGGNCFEWTATMININYGHNKKLLDSCLILKEYTILIEKIKNNIRNNLIIETAVNKAVDECIKEGILKDYLIAHKAEVIGMCITEYNEQETMYAFQLEAKEEEREDGLKSLVNILKKLTPDFETLYNTIIADEKYSDVTPQQVKKYY